MNRSSTLGLEQRLDETDVCFLVKASKQYLYMKHELSLCTSKGAWTRGVRSAPMQLNIHVKGEKLVLLSHQHHLGSEKEATERI